MSHEAGQNQHSQSTQHDRILQALNAVHDTQSFNSLRQEASFFLEKIREDEGAPQQGFQLALSHDQSPIVRHYGLSLLDYAIRHKCAEYTQGQTEALRNWILALANRTSDHDPAYINNKVAELWVEVAKRTWAIDWIDMDQQLITLWEGDASRKKLVLSILEALSECIFTNEDSVATLRGSDLNKACVEIFTPVTVLTEQFPTRENPMNLRSGSDGWLARISDCLDQCTRHEQAGTSRQSLILKILSALRSIITWAIPKALVLTSSVQRMCACLAVTDMAVQLAALDTLYALYNRTRFSDDDFKDIVGPMYSSESLSMLKQLYEWLRVDPFNLDDDRYVTLKKLSEMVFNLGRHLSERPSSMPEWADVTGFISLIMSIMKNESLQVSIPALHLWVKLLESGSISKSSAIQAAIPELLETCSQRLIRYEALPHETSNPSIKFLNEDIETMPERHAFLGNYSRFCNQVVELIVQQQPLDALYHILGQADHDLDHLYDTEPPFIPSAYTKVSTPWLKIDAQFTVVEAALKGCLKWLTFADNETIRREHDIMTSNLRVWCDRLLGLTFEDPVVKERVIQLAVTFAIGPLKQDPQFAVRVFDHILETRCPAAPQCTTYMDAIKDLQVFATQQLQRLAIRFADHLITIFDVVESKVMAVSQDVASDDQTKVRYTSVLFVIMQRASSIDPGPREAKLRQYLEPLIELWQHERLRHSLSSFEKFSSLLGLDNIQQYLASREVYQIKDWASHSLDDEGKMLQSSIQVAVDALPLRAMKHIMSASFEKLERGTAPYEIASRLWQKYLPILLPVTLQFINLSHSAYDPSNWTAIGPEQKSVVRKIFTDRFWQVGISQGTRDDFYASIGGSRATLEGFASSIRATLRLVRETSYRLLSCMSLLGEHFYGLPELPDPLARALFTDACALSPHQLAMLLDTTRPIIENCPDHCHLHFLPPMLSALFDQVDRKTGLEWERIERKKLAAIDDDDLATEMKDESVLRQLTLAAVMLVASLLEPPRPTLTPNNKTKVNGTITHDSTRNFVLQTPQILRPVILFCTHVLRMHDTRASALIAKVLRTIIGDFSGEASLEADAREFISTEVLKACITSLNDQYFVDMQRDFVQLIASIFIAYTPRSETPKQIVCSLPGITNERVDRAVRHLFRAQSDPRKQRAIVLELLQGFRSMTIQEQGKIPKPNPKKLRSTMQQKYLSANMEGMELKDKDEGLEGVAEMFK